MPTSALGIPDRAVFGDPAKLTTGKLYDYVVQHHEAARAGAHKDLRLGSPELGLLSWAIRKGLPAPGQKHLAVAQPIHEHNYRGFEGEIPAGQYGAGKVVKHDSGQALVTKSGPDAVHFSLAHKRYPERYTLIRPQNQDNPKHWLMLNLTPTKPVPYSKIRYQSTPADQAETVLKGLQPGASVQAKIDGAASLSTLTRHGLETFSYRTSKHPSHFGLPISHSERLNHGLPKLNVPKELVGTVLRGELYGARKGKAIPPQELGGLLNASIANSLQQQKERGIDLRNMVFDIQRLGQKPIPPTTPYHERLDMIRDVLKQIPTDKHHAPEEAKEPGAALKLWKAISSGKHPLTREGVVIHHPTGKPEKIKLREEHDVHLRNIFEGAGRLKGVGAGGFRYSHTPEGPIVGEVGTGLSNALRRDMYKNPQEYIGRLAKVIAQGKFQSGALRAPALMRFHSLHEDY